MEKDSAYWADKADPWAQKHGKQKCDDLERINIAHQFMYWKLASNPDQHGIDAIFDAIDPDNTWLAEAISQCNKLNAEFSRYVYTAACEPLESQDASSGVVTDHDIAPLVSDYLLRNQNLKAMQDKVAATIKENYGIPAETLKSGVTFRRFKIDSSLAPSLPPTGTGVCFNDIPLGTATLSLQDHVKRVEKAVEENAGIPAGILRNVSRYNRAPPLAQTEPGYYMLSAHANDYAPSGTESQVPQEQAKPAEDAGESIMKAVRSMSK